MVSLPVPQQRERSIPGKVWWILFVGAALRVTFFFLAENTGGDALARASITAQLLQHPGFHLNFEPWLPLHFWLTAAMSALVGDPGLGARALSLVLGIASLGIVWALAKEVYGESSATLSLLVFALYSLHIGYSTTSSSEAAYLFFMLAGLLGFFVYRRSGSLVVLGLAAIALGISAGIRYEAWICIFAVVVVLILMPSLRTTGGFWGVDHVREVFVFGSIAGLWPLFWMIYQWKNFGKPLYGVTKNYGWVAEQVTAAQTSTLYHLVLPPGVILLTLSPLVVAAAFYGLALGLRHRRSREFALILFIIGTVFAIQIVSGGVASFARYTITVGTLLAIASGFGLERIADFLSRRRARQFRAAVGFLLVLNLGATLTLSEAANPFSDKFASISPRLRFPDRIEGLRQFLKPRLEPNDAVVIDDYNVESNIVAAAIGLPLLPGDRAFLASSQPVSALWEYMDRRRPRYLIYSNRGVLRAYLPLAQECLTSPASLRGMEFWCLYGNDVYRVYAVKYSQPESPD